MCVLLEFLEGNWFLSYFPFQSAEDEDEDQSEAVADDEDGVSVIERMLSGVECDLDSEEATEAVKGISPSKLLDKLQAVEKYLLEQQEEGEKRRQPVDMFMDECDQLSFNSSTTSTLRGGSVQKLGDEDRVQELLEKVSLLEKENEALSGDLDDRPTFSQLEAKVKLADDLQLELIAVQLKVTELGDQLQQSLDRYEKLSVEMQKVQQEVERKDREREEAIKLVAGAGDGLVSSADQAGVKQKEELAKELAEKEVDEQLLTSAQAEVEEELVLFKERFVNLSEENVRLQREMEETRRRHETAMQQSMIKLLMYMSPVVAVLGYLLLWPSL